MSTNLYYRESHLDECGVPPSEAVKPKKERLTMDEMDEVSVYVTSSVVRRKCDIIIILDVSVVFNLGSETCIGMKHR